MIQTLELANFKSYDNGLFEFESGVNIIVGPNASGKTNLLEAMHVVCTSSGFRVSDQELVRFDQEWFRVEALVNDAKRSVKYRDGQKTTEIDGVLRKRVTTTHKLPVVIFEPEHMLLLGKEPSRRRAYLDTFASMVIPSHTKSLASYKRVLAQRNRLLKQPDAGEQQFFMWDVQLAEFAGLVVEGRQRAIELLRSCCESVYRSVSDRDETLELDYASDTDIDGYSNHLLQQLKQNLDTDRLRGHTTVGPHRDDLLVTLKGHDARATASRGETRSIILALKVAELRTLHEELGKAPILLLDDVFSELDGTRRRKLAESLREYQTFLTTTDADVAVDHFSAHNIIPMAQ